MRKIAFVLLFQLSLAKSALAVPFKVNNTLTIQPLGKYIEYVEDDTNDLLFSGHFTQSSSSYLSFGYPDRPYWVRFSLENELSDPKSIFLELSYPLFESVELWAVSNDSRLTTIKTGNQTAFAQRAFKHRTFVF